jgi:hypothetical protein
MKRFTAKTAATAAILLLFAFNLPADPTPAEKPAPEPAAAPVLDTQALAELSVEHSRARDALLAVEARLALMAEKAFDSRLVVRYEGFVDPPFELARVELDLDGSLAYRNEFSRAASSQNIKLFDGHLPPGRHVLQLRVYARGPDDPEGTRPGYFAGSGMTVHLRPKSVCRARFEADSDGDSPGRAVLKQAEPEGEWEIDIEASFETEAL